MLSRRNEQAILRLRDKASKSGRGEGCANNKKKITSEAESE